MVLTEITKLEIIMRDKIAYSLPAKLLSRALVALVFKNARPSWVRGWFAGDCDIKSLLKYR